MATPGVKPTFTELEAGEALPSKLNTASRGAAARGNHLAAGRIDAHHLFKEICRWMSKPIAQAWVALKRVSRYLAGVLRLVYKYLQQMVEGVDVYTDTDWVGWLKAERALRVSVPCLGAMPSSSGPRHKPASP